MTVAELIAKLKSLPAASEVCLEDDNGDTFEVDVCREADWVYLSAGGGIDTDGDDEEEIDIEEDEDDEEDE